MRNPVFKTRGRGGSTVSKKATDYRKEDEAIIFRLYGTDIVKVTPRDIVLDSGGYRTATIKRRMNEISEKYELGFVVWQGNYTWYVDFAGYRFEFKDGMKLFR